MFTVTLVLSLLVLFLFGVFSYVLYYKKESKDLRVAPGPRPWPVLGSLHLLGQAEVPFQAMSLLARKYGPLYNITLGSTQCLIVNDFHHMKEVLITKGGHFGGRPNFIRFHMLFGGDRNNSLALCDWSELQKSRRQVALTYCSPRMATEHYTRLGYVTRTENDLLITEINKYLNTTGNHGKSFQIKPIIQRACANMFLQYMCSMRCDFEDESFREIVQIFDDIFWEINQGYAVDFLPWLLPLYRRHMDQLTSWAKTVRKFILERIIEPRHKLPLPIEPNDFTDALLINLQNDKKFTWEHILFELEDFIGGHSAIGNLVMLCLANLIRNPEKATKVYEEIDLVTGGREVTLEDKNQLPYSDAFILETLRIASSPIVPHVATQDTKVGGYDVKEGTVVFLNNYELNLSDAYWVEADKFRPERFLSGDGLSVVKPEHFIPFSTGKRTCIGQRLLLSCVFSMFTRLVQYYDISADIAQIKTYPACVGLPSKTFEIALKPRTI